MSGLPPYLKSRSEEALKELERLRRVLISKGIPKPHIDLVDYFKSTSLEALEKLGLYYDIYMTMIVSKAEYLAKKLVYVVGTNPKDFKFLLLHGFSEVPRIDFPEELQIVEDLYETFIGKPKFIILLLKAPQRYGEEISPWPLMAHEAGHAVLLHSNYLRIIEEAVRKEISESVNMREAYISYVSEVLADLIASTFITRFFADALEVEFSKVSATQKWGRDHPPLKLRVDIVRSTPDLSELERKYQNDPKALKLLNVLKDLEDRTNILTRLSFHYREMALSLEENARRIQQDISTLDEGQALLKLASTKTYNDPLEVIALAPALVGASNIRQPRRVVEELLLDTYRRLIIKQIYEGFAK